MAVSAVAIRNSTASLSVRDLADAIRSRARLVCPSIRVGEPDKDHWRFFPGSAHEQMLRVSWEIDRAQPYWYWHPVYRIVQDWDLLVTPELLRQNADLLLMDLATRITGIVWQGWDESDAEQHRIAKAVGLARFLLWGVPIPAAKRVRYFHGLFLDTLRRSLPESVWEIACRNAFGGHTLNESILKDAKVEEAHYRTLYGIHPLLGRAWAPWVRKFVQDTLGEDPDAGRYAQQLRAALGVVGVRPAGFRTLHRLAEHAPLRFNGVLYLLSNAFRHANERGIRQTLAWLNDAPARKRPAPGVTWSSVFVLEFDDPQNGEPIPSFEDRVAIERIRGWLKRSKTAQALNLDAPLIRDWLFHAHERGTGNVHRGFSEAVRPYRRPDGRISPKGIAEALRWADRAQRRWHRERDQRPAAMRSDREPLEWRWEPLLESRTDYEIPLPNGAVWTFRELLSSAELQEEGRLLHHCVGTYDLRCARGESCIFAVTDPQGQRVSTLEIHLGWESPKRKRFRIEQHRGPCNAEVSEAAERAALGLLQFLNADDYTEEARKRLAKRHAKYLAQKHR